MIKLKQAVIVEGKYDKIKLDNFIDAIIITTEGFNIYNNPKKREYIKKLADEVGIIILTDSDSAGMMIRSKIKGFVDSSKITDVYVPKITGTEKRKTSPGAEGILGVEGISEELILTALKNAGVNEIKDKNAPAITKGDFYVFGLYGKENSLALRKAVCKKLNLPDNLTVNRLLSYVNKSGKINEFKEAVKLCRLKEDKE